MIDLAPGGATVGFGGTALDRIPVNFEDAIVRGHFWRFPLSMQGVTNGLWAPQSGDSGIEIILTNQSGSCPMAPMLVDVVQDPVAGISGSLDIDGIHGPLYTVAAELKTVQPGQTRPELYRGLPVTRMLLVIWYLGIDWYAVNPFTGNNDSKGFSAFVTVKAV